MSRRTNPQNLLVRYGARVRALREERELTREEFADRIGLDRTYVSGIERGVRNVSLRNIGRIADGLGIPISELFA